MHTLKTHNQTASASQNRAIARDAAETGLPTLDPADMPTAAQRKALAADAPEAPRVKSGWKHADLTPGQILGLRYSRALAYKNGQYKMEPPPVCTTLWDDEAWHNWVQFNNQQLTGFLPYTK
jgi:hypothetical protein